MVLAAQAKRIVAANIEHLVVDRVIAIGVAMALDGFLGDLAQPHPFDRRRRAGKVFLDKIAGEPDRVKDLRPAIGLIGRNAHLGHDLQDAFADGFQVILLHRLGVERQIVFDADLVERGKGEIGVDRLGAIAGKRAEMVDLACLAGFDDDPGERAQPLSDQMMMHRRGREQRRDRHPLCRGRAIGQDQDVVPGFDRLGRLAAQPFERRRQAVGALGRRPGRIERVGAERRD